MIGRFINMPSGDYAYDSWEFGGTMLRVLVSRSGNIISKELAGGTYKKPENSGSFSGGKVKVNK